MPEDNQTTNIHDNPPPPIGDPKSAERYLNQLISLIETDKITVHHTDLSKFDPSALEDHYRIDLKNYLVEVSHSKNPNTGKDQFILLFNNIKQVRDECTEKVILAYLHLEDIQYSRFKNAADAQILKIHQLAEQKRLAEALAPIETFLENLSST